MGSVYADKLSVADSLTFEVQKDVGSAAAVTGHSGQEDPSQRREQLGVELVEASGPETAETRQPLSAALAIWSESLQNSSKVRFETEIEQIDHSNSASRQTLLGSPRPYYSRGPPLAEPREIREFERNGTKFCVASRVPRRGKKWATAWKQYERERESQEWLDPQNTEAADILEDFMRHGRDPEITLAISNARLFLTAKQRELSQRFSARAEHDVEWEWGRQQRGPWEEEWEAVFAPLDYRKHLFAGRYYSAYAEFERLFPAKHDDRAGATDREGQLLEEEISFHSERNGRPMVAIVTPFGTKYHTLATLDACAKRGYVPYRSFAIPRMAVWLRHNREVSSLESDFSDLMEELRLKPVLFGLGVEWKESETPFFF